MPKSHQLVLALLAVFITAAVFIFNGYTRSSLAAQGQAPIDPTTLSGEFDATDTRGEFYGRRVASAEVENKQLLADASVLGDTTAPKRIEVDLAAQRLYAFEGDNKVYDFLISSGKWGRTPTGTFTIWGKFRYTKMEGGSKEKHTYYYLPNVPFVMFFSNSEVPAGRGFSIHGTYWHENFGTPMSHGCINMKTPEAEQIFNWALPNIGDAKTGKATAENPGTPVIIYGVAPGQ